MALDPTALYEKIDSLVGSDKLTEGPEMNQLLKDVFESLEVQTAADAAATAADRVQTGFDVSATGANAAVTAADRVQTGFDVAATGADATATAADRVQTGSDRVATGEDKVATAADRVQTGLDVVATNADAVATAADRVQTGLDRVATGEDKLATAADRVQTGLDRVATGEDKVATAADRVQTGSDRVATGEDKVATAADRVQTGLDVAATNADAVATAADRVAVAADKDYVESLVVTAGTYPLWYGVQFDTTISSPDGTRIGNSDLHRELPIQNGMYGCVLADNGVEAYRLNPANWAEKINGGASVLDGTDGQVMVYVPGFYFKYELVGTTWRFKISQFELPGFTYSKPQYVSAYEASVRRADNVLSSVKNTTAAYRGGNNNAAWDAEDRTLLGMAATSLSRTNYRTYARARGAGWEMYNYYAHWKITWLFTVEYATLNSQKAYNAALDVNGYRQGGLGNGVTNLNGTHWNAWNLYYLFVPCGYTDSLSNGTGEVSFIMPAGYNAGSGLQTFANRYRGIEQVFGHGWKNVDGINIRAAHAADADPTHRIYVSENPAHWNDANYNNMTDIGIAPRADGYIKQMLPGHLVPLIATGGGSTTFWCDYWYQNIPASAPALRTLLLGGAALSGALAGLGCSYSADSPASAIALIGSRLCFISA
ncbi:MAG: hypothetical protein KGZ82_10590 [Bacteroidales bacterium]|nr:hypothetical protein [Bacteroidales bacterium]